ncbi:YHYH protein [Croceivirga thetidis]|uniref:YHYH protein n=1 Tax=Croceivirga thetidis TaxID=2721623 RepID=A0ABX1GKE1_9FLAO|nr:YHYH protein [Croceivirga thetidis]NKI30380.1 YHYH protein [Croceivirga thetidis]
MKVKTAILILSIGIMAVLACSSDADDSIVFTDDESTTDDDGTAEEVTLSAAFSEFDANETTIYLDGNNVVIETTGFPNHETVYWGVGNELYREEPDVDLTPSRIPNFDGSATLVVSANPQLASSSTSTSLGAIGIAVSGAAIFNDQEGNGPLSGAAGSLDWTGAHIGPSVYHYHLEPKAWSDDDGALIGILADGFFIYGRRDYDGNYPTDLDESGGHFGPTPHNPEEEYHYHIQNELYLNQYYVIFPGDYQGTPSSIN